MSRGKSSLRASRFFHSRGGAARRRVARARFALPALLLSLAAVPAFAADPLFPDGPPLCESDFGVTSGQNTGTDLYVLPEDESCTCLNSNSAFVRADGGAGQTHSSTAEIGVLFTPVYSHPATVKMGAEWFGRLVGALDLGTIFGEIQITVTLRDETDNLPLGSVVLEDKKEEGDPGFQVISFAESDKFNPPVATFANVDLVRNHDYSVTLKAVARAKGLAGESDFKDTGYVRFNCVLVEAELLDSDGDGLYDVWEDSGIDVDGDTLVDVDLPGFGADKNHKDLFVEVDWRPGQQPSQAAVRAMKAMFAAAPIDAGGTDNPDNQPGINLWVDTGSFPVGREDGAALGSCTDGVDNGGGDETGDGVAEIDGADPDCQGFEDGSANPLSCIDGIDNGGNDGVDAADPDCYLGDDLGGGGQVLPAPVICLDDSFYDSKALFFAANRLLAFRYAVSGISPDENTCKNAPGGKGEIGGNDFIVYSADPGTMVHELGHTLNLRHGGFENLNNKPNYISMMNYNYGLSIRQFSGAPGLIDYSPPLCATCPGGRGAIPDDLDESQLDETEVLDPNDVENMTQFRDLGATTTNWPVNGIDIDLDTNPDFDWDGDGVVANGTVEVDVNEDGKCVTPGSDGTLETMMLSGDDFVPSGDNIVHDGPNRVCETLAHLMDVQKKNVGEGQPDILAGYDDWSNIVLSPRRFGEQANGPVNAAPEERSLAETRAQAEENNTTDLEIVKTDLPDPVNAGEELVYGLTVTNHGPSTALGVRVVDPLPAEATYVSDTGGCVEEPAGTLTCRPGTLVPGQSASFTVTVVYLAEDVAALPAPAIVENTVTVENKVPYGLNGSLGEVGGDPDQSNNSDSEETTVNRPPVSDPNGPYLEECQGPMTAVQLDGSASYDPDGDPITFEWTTDCPGGVFDEPTAEMPILTLQSPPPCPVLCEATLEVTDPGGLSDTASTMVTIEDTTPPEITVELAPTGLWPPNHEMVEISATVVATDVCDPSPEVVLTSIVSDEPDDAKGNGDGNTVDDIQDAAYGTSDFQFRLRAERAGSGAGRTYTVTYTAIDDCGLATPKSATVFVPHH